MDKYRELTQDEVRLRAKLQYVGTVSNRSAYERDPGVLPQPEAVIAEAQSRIADAEVEIVERDRRAALAARFDYDTDLAEATCMLISGAKQLVMYRSGIGPHVLLARFRKELQPLAKTYGVKIVLVGAKSTATLALE